MACGLPVLYGKLGVGLVFRADHLGFHMSDDVLCYCWTDRRKQNHTPAIKNTLGGRGSSLPLLKKFLFFLLVACCLLLCLFECSALTHTVKLYKLICCTVPRTTAPSLLHRGAFINLQREEEVIGIIIF